MNHSNINDDVDKWAPYRQACRKEGVSEEEIEREIARMRAEAQALDAGACPNCAQEILGCVDPRQVGDKPNGTRWMNYRCKCGYMVDRAEPAPIGTA